MTPEKNLKQIAITKVSNGFIIDEKDGATYVAYTFEDLVGMLQDWNSTSQAY